jgi:molybdopterin-guanine dinucleotide biosynthesis protein A
MSRWGALVLAGGKAQRFQTPDQPWQDKALAELDGKPLLVHLIQNLHGAVDEIAICVNDEERKVEYRETLEKYGLEANFVVDEKSKVGGPLLAILSGLRAVSADYCLTVPTDMPFLSQKIADYMFKAAEGFDVTVPMWPDGTLETLLMALNRKDALVIAETLCLLGKSPADGVARGASKLLIVSPLNKIKLLDPEFRSFININLKEDLNRPQTRNTMGKVTENIKFDRGSLPAADLTVLQCTQKMLDDAKFLHVENIFSKCASYFEDQKLYFWAGVSHEKIGDTQLKLSIEGAKESFQRAASNYQKEAETYEAKGCRALAQRGLDDAAWCQSRV